MEVAMDEISKKPYRIQVVKSLRTLNKALMKFGVCKYHISLKESVEMIDRNGYPPRKQSENKV